MAATTTLANLRTKIRVKLDDNQFDSTSIDQSVNDYVADLTNRRQFVFMEASDTLSLAKNSAEMDVPDDLQRLLALVRTSDPAGLITKNRLDYDNFMQLYPTYKTNPALTPDYWTTFGQKIRFQSPADATYSFQVDYLAAASYLVNDGDICVIPDEFSELVVLGSLYRIMKIDNDYDLSMKEQADIVRMETALISRYGRGMDIAGPKRMMSSFRG